MAVVPTMFNVHCKGYCPGAAFGTRGRQDMLRHFRAELIAVCSTGARPFGQHSAARAGPVRSPVFSMASILMRLFEIVASSNDHVCLQSLFLDWGILFLLRSRNANKLIYSRRECVLRKFALIRQAFNG